MKYRITKEHVWAGLIEDRPGALGEKLRDLSAGGLDLELIITRRELSGRATMFVSPLRTVEELEIAAKSGLARAGNVRTIRIEGPNGVGLGAKNRDRDRRGRHQHARLLRRRPGRPPSYEHRVRQ